RDEPAPFVGATFQRALLGGYHRAVDRTDQRRDVARGRSLASTFAEGAGWIAAETGDEDIVPDDQHPAKVQIAMMTNPESVDAVGEQGAEALRQRRAMRQDSVDQRQIGLLYGLPPRGESFKNSIRTRDQAV